MEKLRICENCPKDKCPYSTIPSYYIRRGECPFNPAIKESVQEKIRVGQQKQKKQKRRNR